MEREPLTIPDLLLLRPKVFEDRRGFFFETYRRNEFASLGITVNFVQDNQSGSIRNALRGLHYQIDTPQAKLVRVVKGEVFDVAVDVRVGSPWFGRHCGMTLSESNRKTLYIPAGFAHGFYVLSEYAEFAYKCSDYYSPRNERGILWSDPELGIQWPLDAAKPPILSDKDLRYKPLREMDKADLPVYAPPA
ncbi:MAG: dTDP-4-dehydrorhamnose 3,5-epimerase [Planctomycetota bacterium]|jgi:dTDP-4-dehydrorhamnose 3,5-epimerase|nr:dTDP-4-dehydrorhamnose 3,5-epimerase [Planctomycetota bacterium]